MTGNPIPPVTFFLHPTLTDSGVLALLLSQHLALCCSAFYLISVASRHFLVRLVVAGIWAANPLFYAFAHCVGSETLSMILLLLLGATGIKISSYRRNVPWRDWLLFGLLLWLGILTRHLNALLAMLMPLTFFFLSAHWLALSAFARSKLMKRGRRLRARQDLKKMAVTLLIGLSCIILANISLRGLCYAAHTPYQFPAGFPFLWRLEFLARLPPQTANEFLDRVSRDTSAPDVKETIAKLREAIRENTNWESTAFVREVQTSLLAPGSKSQEEVMSVLNRTVLAFLWPPRDLFVSAVAADLARARMITIPNVARSLFVHTIFYYSHRDAMPGYAPLVTFRDKTADDILASYKRHSYFYHRKEFSYNAVWCLWFAMTAILAVVRNKRSGEIAVVYYASVLTLVGLTMMLVTCLLNEFQPRYTLPMWELTIISLSVVLGRGMDFGFQKILAEPESKRV